MQSVRPSATARYALAIVSVILAIGARRLLDPVVGMQYPFPTIQLAIVFAAWIGGFRTAVVAVLVGAFGADYFLLPPRGALSLASASVEVGLLLYLVTGLGIATLGGLIHAAYARAVDTGESLERRVEERTRELAATTDRLRASEERLRMLVDGDTGHAIFMLDVDGNVATWNPGAERIFGYTADQIVGTHASRLYSQGDVSTGKPARDLTFATRHGALQEEMECVRQDATSIWASVMLAPLYAEGGAPAGFGFSAQDVTARKRAELGRAESEELLAFALRTSRTGAWELDLSTHKARQTPEHAAIFGYDSPQSDWSSTKFLSHVVPEDREDVARTIGEAVAAGREWNVECRIRRVDGAERWIVTSARHRGDGLTQTRRVTGIVQDITERKEAQQALLIERNLLRTLIDTLPDLVIIKDLETRYTVCNVATLKLLGVARETDMLGKTVYDFLSPEMAARHDAHDRMALSRTRTTFDEEPITDAEGNRRWYRPARFPLVDQTGATIGLLIVSADITARHIAEEALRASEERFRLLVEGVSGHAIFMLDPEGRILTWNSEAARINGYSGREIIGRHYTCLFTQDDIENDVPGAELEEAAALGRVEVEGWRVRKDGVRFWANGTIAAIYDEDHNVRGFAKVTRDLTEKRRNDELLKSVLNHTIDGIVSVDEHGVISLINRAGEELFGRTADDLVGQNVTVLMPHAYRRHYEKAAERMIRSGEASVFGKRREGQGLRRDGSTFPVELALTEFRLDNHRQFVGIVRDLSDRKQLESQLHQSQKMEAFGQLAGGVAHDFNNLLTVISGYSEVLLRALPESGDHWAMVEEIRRAGEQAASLTRQLLAFSRQQVLEPRVLDLNVVVHNTEKLLRRLIGEDVIFESRLQRDIHAVRVDPGQIEQVVINLAVNARDAMPQGGTLQIQTREVEVLAGEHADNSQIAPGKYVTLTVRDTGAGMPSDVKARIFEPFFTTKGVGKGTGLGLAVVHGIVKQSGGSIEVESEIDVGTTFTIYLPIVTQPVNTSGEVVSIAPSRGTETILLVEDEAGVRELASLALRNAGYTVIAAAGSRDAIAHMRDARAHAHLLVTDVVMPEMSGSKLAEILLAQHPSLKVLYVSGYTPDAVVRHGVQQAEVAFLQKPFTPSALARKVREVLDREATGSPPVTTDDRQA